MTIIRSLLALFSIVTRSWHPRVARVFESDGREPVVEVERQPLTDAADGDAHAWFPHQLPLWPAHSTTRVFRLCVVAVALSLWLAVIMTAAEAHATSCAAISDEDAMARADVAFTAVCIGVRKDAQRGFVATLDVQRVYKGIVPPKLELATGGMKDASFSAHESYAVFMRADVPSYAHLCGGTRPLDREPWPSSFGAGEPPDPNVSQIAAAPSADDAPSADAVAPVTTPPEPHGDAPPAFDATAPMLASPATLPVSQPPPERAHDGGCAGCQLGVRDGDPLWLAWLLLFSRWLCRPPRRCRA